MVIVPSNFKKKVIKQLKSNCSVGFHDVNVYSVMSFRPNQIICIAYIIVLHMLTCTAHICFLYKDTDVYFLMMKYNIIHSVFLTQYQSHLLVAMIFCPYGIFKSNFCLPWCFFRCIHLLWLPTAAVKTLRYSHAIVRSRINTVRPLLSSNYRNRAKLHLRDLLNLIKSQDFIKLPSRV